MPKYNSCNPLSLPQCHSCSQPPALPLLSALDHGVPPYLQCDGHGEHVTRARLSWHWLLKAQHRGLKSMSPWSSHPHVSCWKKLEQELSKFMRAASRSGRRTSPPWWAPFRGSYALALEVMASGLRMFAALGTFIGPERGCRFTTAACQDQKCPVRVLAQEQWSLARLLFSLLLAYGHNGSIARQDNSAGDVRLKKNVIWGQPSCLHVIPKHSIKTLNHEIICLLDLKAYKIENVMRHKKGIKTL